MIIYIFFYVFLFSDATYSGMGQGEVASLQLAKAKCLQHVLDMMIGAGSCVSLGKLHRGSPFIHPSYLSRGLKDGECAFTHLYHKCLYQGPFQDINVFTLF